MFLLYVYSEYSTTEPSIITKVRTKTQATNMSIPRCPLLTPHIFGVQCLPASSGTPQLLHQPQPPHRKGFLWQLCGPEEKTERCVLSAEVVGKGYSVQAAVNTTSTTHGVVTYRNTECTCALGSQKTLPRSLALVPPTWGGTNLLGS